MTAFSQMETGASRPARLFLWKLGLELELWYLHVVF